MINLSDANSIDVSNLSFFKKNGEEITPLNWSSLLGSDTLPVLRINMTERLRPFKSPPSLEDTDGLNTFIDERQRQPYSFTYPSEPPKQHAARIAQRQAIQYTSPGNNSLASGGPMELYRYDAESAQAVSRRYSNRPANLPFQPQLITYNDDLRHHSPIYPAQ